MRVLAAFSSISVAVWDGRAENELAWKPRQPTCREGVATLAQ